MKILALIMLLFSWLIPLLFFIGLGALFEYYTQFMGVGSRDDSQSLGERFPMEGKDEY